MIARTWFRRVRLRTCDTEVFHALRYLACDPDIAELPAEEIAISVEPCGLEYRITQDGLTVHDRLSADAVADTLHAEMLRLSLADFPTAPVLHAASLRRAGQRVLLVGRKGGGKTTLTLRLIQEGYEVEGDENVFVTSEGVVARPRALRVKDSTASFFAHLIETLSTTPYYQNGKDLRTYNLDPREAGARFWRIERGPADAVVLLRPNHGGQSSLRPISPLPLVREVIAESAFPETGRSGAVSAITMAIGNARGFDLSLGDLDGAVVCLDQVMSKNA